MRSLLFHALAAFLASGIASGATDAEQFAAAVRPLEEGVPEASLAPLRRLLDRADKDAERAAIAEKLGEALVAAHRPSDALEMLAQPLLGNSWTARFQRAQALAALGRAADAAMLFRELTKAPHSLRSAAIYGEGEMLRATGDSAHALQRYSELFTDAQFSVRSRIRSAELLIERGDLANAHRLLEEVEPKRTAEKRERRGLRGRFELASGRPDRAISILQPLLQRVEGTPHDVVVAALIAIADAHAARGTPETGDNFLEDYIEHHPTDPSLPRLFARLDQLYTMERRPGRGELERWAHDPAQPRRILSQWYVARLELRGRRRERALRDFDELARAEPRSPESVPALLEFADLKIADRDHARAIEILGMAKAIGSTPALAARVDFALGRAHELAGDPRSAAVSFDRARKADGPVGPAAMLNASLAWLQAGDDAQVQSHSTALTDEAQADLRLEEGFNLSNKNDPRAAEVLRGFLRDFPHHPRVSEVWTALAEREFHATPPRPKEARENLDRAMQGQPTAVARERAAYLQVWLDDATPGGDDKLITAATIFLRDFTGSKFVPDVRMKLAETYFRRQDFANAQTHFELLAQQNAASPFADKALFFAAQCAAASFEPHAIDRALALLSQVVRSQGEFKWAARNQQASIERRLGKLEEAQVLYDEVLKNDARPADKREALCGKGDIFLELGSKDSANYARAIECYTQLAGEAGVSAHWRNQALFKQAVCVEKQGNRDSALEIFYRVIAADPRDKAAEFFWFYKAGFDAARLLEEMARWDSAATIYERLASTGGSRSGEAKSQLDRLRLEHFIWKE